MTNKYFILIIITTIISIAVVVYMYSQNYISFESGIRIMIPAKSDQKYVESPMEPADTQIIDTNLVSTPLLMAPSSNTTKSNEPRLYDDIITGVKTFSPILAPMIPLYLNRKHKQKTKEATV